MLKKNTIYVNSQKQRHELKLGVVLSYTLIVLNVVSGFLLMPFIIRGIGQSNYGIYTAASSLITMFLVDLGLGAAVTKFTSKYRVTSNQEQIEKTTSVIFYCFLFLSFLLLVLFFAIFFFLGNIYSSFTDEELNTFKVVYIIVASYSVLTFPFSICNGMLVAYDKIFLAKISDIISKIVFIIATIIVLVFDLGIYFLTACYALHGLVGIILKLIFVHFKTPSRFFVRMEKVEFFNIFKESIVFSIWAAINSFGRVILISFCPAIIAFASPKSFGTAEIAIFSIAIQIESYVSLFATAFGSMFYPSISRILFSSKKDYKNALTEFHKFHIKIARVQVMVLSLVTVGIIVFGNEFVNLWVGSDYSKSYYCILAICIPALFFYPLQTAENAMAAIEKIKFCSFATIMSVIAGIALSIGLSFALGSIGAALGVCFGLVCRTVLFNVCFSKFLSINPIKFYLKSYFSILIPAIISACFGIILNFIINDYSWVTFILKALAVSIIYLVFLFLIALNKDERCIFDKKCVKIYKKVFSILRRIGVSYDKE